MAVRIVTDSTADLPRELVKKLGIEVVPLTVRFGNESYLDGVNLSGDQFFQKLVSNPVLPTTGAPSPGTFGDLYRSIMAKGDEVVSIHISNKLSATYTSAATARGNLPANSPVEVIDSMSVSMGLGLIVLQAARAAAAGARFTDVVKLVKEKMPLIRLYGIFDTLEYLQKGGRIGRAQAFLGSLLNLKPIVVILEGEVHPFERVRTKAKAMNRVLKLVEDSNKVDEVAVLHATSPGDLEDLSKRIGAVVPGTTVHRCQFGPVLGTYVGPGAMALCFLEK